MQVSMIKELQNVDIHTQLNYFSTMKPKSSCGGQGCRTTIILPHDRSISNVSSGVLQVENDIQKVLPIASVPLEKKAA